MRVIETDKVELGQIRSDGINHYLIIYNPPDFFVSGENFNAVQLTDNLESNGVERWETLYQMPVNAEEIKDDLPTILSGKLIIEVGE